MACSPYVVYVDESGDRGLNIISPHSPVFVLCAAVYRIDDYLAFDHQTLGRLKFNLWWHDNVVLRSYDIRKRNKPFSALADPQNEKRFLEEMARFFKSSKATIIAAAIHKVKHKAHYAEPADPYFLAMQFVLERIWGHIYKASGDTSCIFEARGRTDDDKLRQDFNKICNGNNKMGNTFPFRMHFAEKKANLAGLQLADLAAYPIGKYAEDPKTKRRDWQLVKPLIRTSFLGKMEGYGLKIFP